MTSKWIATLNGRQADYQCFPQCPGLSFYLPYKSSSQYRVIDYTFILCVSCFISLLSPESRAKQHLPSQRAQSRRLLSHHHRPSTEDGTHERSQRPNWRNTVWCVSTSRINAVHAAGFDYGLKSKRRSSSQARHPEGSHQLSDPRQQQDGRTWHHCAVWWCRAPPEGLGVSLHPQPKHHQGCSVQKLS